MKLNKKKPKAQNLKLDLDQLLEQCESIRNHAKTEREQASVRSLSNLKQSNNLLKETELLIKKARINSLTQNSKLQKYIDKRHQKNIKTKLEVQKTIEQIKTPESKLNLTFDSIKKHPLHEAFRVNKRKFGENSHSPSSQNKEILPKINRNEVSQSVNETNYREKITLQKKMQKYLEKELGFKRRFLVHKPRHFEVHRKQKSGTQDYMNEGSVKYQGDLERKFKFEKIITSNKKRLRSLLN